MRPRLTISMLSLLWYFIGQSKSQNQLRFKRWENRHHLVKGRCAHEHINTGIVNIWGHQFSTSLSLALGSYILDSITGIQSWAINPLYSIQEAEIIGFLQCFSNHFPGTSVKKDMHSVLNRSQCLIFPSFLLLLFFHSPTPYWTFFELTDLFYSEEFKSNVEIGRAKVWE